MISAAIAQALAVPGVWLLVFAATLAGLVRGFSGFGSGLVFMPLAGMALPPAQAIAVLAMMDLIGPLPNLPSAWRTGIPREIGILSIGLLPGIAIGFLALLLVAADVFRWGVSLIGLVTVVALASGWRWTGARGPGMTAGVGFLSGLTGAAAGVPGPPVILYYMASTLPVSMVRANLMMFLVAIDLVLTVLLGLTGHLSLLLVVLSAGLLVPFSLANMLGSALFRPERARSYKLVSWALIAAAALVGLPLWV